MNRFERFSIILPLLFVLSMSMSYAADYKIGVVNAAKILETAPHAEVARKKLEKEFATRDRDLRASQKDLKGLEDRFTKDGAIMSEAERARLQRDIVNKRRELKRDMTELQEDVNFRQNEEMGKIQRKIAEAISTLAKEQSFDMVLQNFVYASEKIDITDQVIEQLKKEAN